MGNDRYPDLAVKVNFLRCFLWALLELRSERQLEPMFRSAAQMNGAEFLR